jgi:hypothetical protein
MIEEEDSIFASYAGGPTGLRISFSQEPTEIIASGEYIFTKITLHKNNQQLGLRFANFHEYTNDNGITFNLESDNGDMPLYARIVEKDNSGKMHLVHNHNYERVLVAHENECPACSTYKPCSKSSYHSISVTAEQNELMLYLQVYHPPLPDAASSSLYYLLVSTADRSVFVLSNPFRIVEEIHLSTNALKRKLKARYLRWLSDFMGSLIPDDDAAEDSWVALDNAITHKLRAIGALVDDAPPPQLEDVEKLIIPLLKAIAQGQLGNTFPVQKQYFNGWTIAHFACALGFSNVVANLTGVDTDVVDMNGRRADYYATLWGYRAIAELLNKNAKRKLSAPSPSFPNKPPLPPPRTKFVIPPKLQAASAKQYPLVT